MSDHTPCANCAHVDRRRFLAQASLLGAGAVMVAACGDGIIGAPSVRPDLAFAPVRVDPSELPALRTVGGRAIARLPNGVAVLIERITDAQYRGIALACPHQGTTVTVFPDRFECPNHGARFSSAGEWRGGQPTADLTRVAVLAQLDGSLLVGGVPLPPKPPTLELSARALSFVADASGTGMPTQTVTLRNGGDGALGRLALAIGYPPASPSGWLSATLSATSAPTALALSATRGVLAAGAYEATLSISAENAPTQTLVVSLVVQDLRTPAALQLSLSSVALTAMLGESSPATVVQVLNTGSGTVNDLAIDVVYERGLSGWLADSSLNRAATPAVLTLRPDTSTLPLGEYTARVNVRGAGVAARTLAVLLVVDVQRLSVKIADWPALSNIGGVAGSVGELNGTPIAVTRLSDTSFAAFSMVCPHAGTTIQVINGTSFRCPNHGALFDVGGRLLPNSPQQTSSLFPRSVRYAPGAPELFVS